MSDIKILLCTISETSITIVIDKQIECGYGLYPGNVLSLKILTNNKIFIAHCHDGDVNGKYYLYGMIGRITETDIIIEKHMELSSIENFGRAISAIVISKTNIFIAHSQGFYNLKGMLVDLNKYVQTATQSDKIFGIATTKAIDGQLVKVVTPNYIEEEN